MLHPDLLVALPAAVTAGSLSEHYFAFRRLLLQKMTEKQCLSALVRTEMVWSTATGLFARSAGPTPPGMDEIQLINTYEVRRVCEVAHCAQLTIFGSGQTRNLSVKAKATTS